jgi:hypothetical protein
MTPNIQKYSWNSGQRQHDYRREAHLLVPIAALASPAAIPNGSTARLNSLIGEWRLSSFKDDKSETSNHPMRSIILPTGGFD